MAGYFVKIITRLKTKPAAKAAGLKNDRNM